MTVGMHMSTICLKPWHAHLRRTGAVRANVLTILILRMKFRKHAFLLHLHTDSDI